MTQEYQLRILPEIAANEQRLKEYISCLLYTSVLTIGFLSGKNERV